MRDADRQSIYDTWKNIRRRCNTPTHPRYKDYGGRGITVCDRWDNFENFFIDLGPRPAGMTLDRRDNDLGYCPENCRWATPKEQSTNRRNSIWVNMGEEKITLKEACRRLRLPYRLTHQRITRDNWSIEKAISVKDNV